MGGGGEAGVCVFLRYSSFIRFPASPTLTTNVVETKAALLAFVIFSYIYMIFFEMYVKIHFIEDPYLVSCRPFSLFSLYFSINWNIQQIVSIGNTGSYYATRSILPAPGNSSALFHKALCGHLFSNLTRNPNIELFQNRNGRECQFSQIRGRSLAAFFRLT